MMAAGVVALAGVLAGCTGAARESVQAGSGPALTGTVVGITDGDTIRVLTGDRQQVKVRLAEIDAPEEGQPFGERSRQALAEVCFQKPVRVVTDGQDKYGRTLGRVYCNDVDANAAQVRAGMAWVYDRYVKDTGLYRLQEQATAAQAGLWSALFTQQPPIRPWEWRRGAR